MSEAELLLLSLEAEAAAARNADLSRFVDHLQSQLQASAREHYSPTRTVSVATVGTQTSSLTEERAVYVLLDDCLFDIAAITAFLLPSGPLHVPVRQRNSPPSLLAIAQCVSEQMKGLQRVCANKVETANRLSTELLEATQRKCRGLEAETQDMALQKERMELKLREAELRVAQLMEENARLAASLELCQPSAAIPPDVGFSDLRRENAWLHCTIARLQEELAMLYNCVRAPLCHSTQ